MIQLIPDWKEAYRLASVNFMLLATTVQVTWASLPEDMRQSVPTGLVSGITIALLVLGVFGRITMKKDDSVSNS